MRRIILAGVGQIGFRHLQALAQLSGQAQIHVYDTSTERLQFCAENINWGSVSPVLTVHSHCNDLPKSANLLVVATSSAPRRQIFDQIVGQSEFAHCVLEKVLFQRRADLTAVADVIRRRSISTWVNCTRRTWPGYQVLRQRIAGSGPIQMTVHGGEWGLACNSIHFIDIFCLLSGESVSEVDTSGLDLPAVESKRPGYIEFTGSLVVIGSAGSVLRMTAVRDTPASPVAISLNVPSLGLNFEINEAAQTIRSIQTGAATTSMSTDAFGVTHTSQLTSEYENILSGGNVYLAPYLESASQHEKLLAAFQKALGFKNDEPCPIT